MKILLITLLISTVGYSQARVSETGILSSELDSLYYGSIILKSEMAIQPWKPLTFTIVFEDRKELRFKVSGDSLIASGNLKPNKAAQEFINYTVLGYTKLVDSLRKEIIKCKSAKQ